ncbi:PAS domain S-box protein [Methanoregula sp. UBA64]|jgi:PAS domain S-box-containing protein|uniref:hybrid sensor histidine kinase/response regulator n=1 Tax=Methanoregula sp. UBA64 TaxID=1915554 RepID=UPI0025FC7AA2|nr:PAS domain S-box protein [Methanoregula sp. UBA64]
MTHGEISHPLSILYVDDEAGLLDIGKMFLETMGGFNVTTQISAGAALESLTTTPYDAIISDYQMPEMDGIAFLKQVRADHPDIPFILFTGRGREEIVIEAIENGADFYLQKGGDPTAQFSELAHKLRQAVRSRIAERELAESRDYLGQIFSNVKAGIFVIDIETHRITDINPEASVLIGLKKEEIVGKMCHNFICTAEEGRCPITDLGQSVDDAERTLLSADGRQVSVIKYVTRITLNGRPCLLETFIDNTRRKETEQQLQAAYRKLSDSQNEIEAAYAEVEAGGEQLQALIDSVSDAVFLISDGKFVRCNRRTPEIFGCKDTSEILGHTPADFSPRYQPDGSFSADLIAAYDRTALSGTPFSFEWVHLRRNGTPFSVEVSLSPVEIRGKMYIRSIVRDLSDRKNAEQAAALATRKLVMMQAFTRHETTNTITGLTGLMDMAQKMPEGSDRDRIFSEMKEKAGELQRQMAFTKEYQEVGVKAPRWQAVREMIPAQEEPAIHCSPQISGLEIYADPLVGKIFSYLAENVVKHGVRATRIDIGAEVQGPLRLTFRDNGVGIGTEMKSAIFSRKAGETRGMGLFLVSEILMITGITIAETGTPGEGACFEITVPEGGFRFANGG